MVRARNTQLYSISNREMLKMNEKDLLPSID